MIGITPTARPVRPSAVAFVVLCLVATALAGVVPAPAAAKPKQGGRHQPTVRILAPKREARTARKTLAVRVRVPTTKGFHAEVSHVDVTGRFHRRGHLLEATLRRGRDYALGENLLAVRVGRGRVLPTTVPFVSLRQAKDLLKVTELAAHGTKPLRFRIRASAPLVGLEVTIDGKRYRVGSVEGRRAWTVAVGASDGVHFGSNEIVVAAERAGSKRYDREVVHFGVGRAAPLAGAGADQVTRSGKAVVLRGGSTVAGSRHGSLIYRWHIVKKPAGSQARIADGTKVNARLLPDLPGAYRVQLDRGAGEQGDGGRRRRRRRREASSTEAAAQPTCLEAALTPLTPAGTGGSDGNGPTGKGAGPNYEPSGGNTPFVPLDPTRIAPLRHPGRRTVDPPAAAGSEQVAERRRG